MPESKSAILSKNPYIELVHLGLTLAHIWFDHTAIDLTASDVADLVRQVEWTSGGQILLRTDRAFDGILELLILPGYTENHPDNFQQCLDYIKLVLRAACPSCEDYQSDRSQLQLPLEVDSATH